MERAIHWDAENAAKFQGVLRARVSDGDGRMTDEDLTDWRERALLYPQEGTKMAYAWGLQSAQEALGMTGWRRVLGYSKTGPCEKCFADTENVYAITTPFFEFHPNGACTQQMLEFWRGEESFMPYFIPGGSQAVPVVREG